MAGLSGNLNIEKLSDTNYESWQIQMSSILICNDLWQYVNSECEKSEENAQEWVMKDRKALALIHLSVTKTQLNLIKKAKTSKEAWDTLKDAHVSRGPVRKTILYKQLIRMKKESGQSMSEHIAAFLNKAELLEEAGIEIPKEMLSIMLLSSLPPEYDGFCTAMEIRDDIPTVESLKLKLIEQEAKRDDKNETKFNEGTNDALFVKGKYKQYHKGAREKEHKEKPSHKKFNLKCFKCGKEGHKANDCRSRRTFATRNNAEDAMPAIILSAEPQKLTKWCLDSGATKHMCNDKSKFLKINYNTKHKVYTAAEYWTTSTGTGDVNIDVNLHGNETNKIKLSEVMYVPDFRNNLLSVSRMTACGYKVTFYNNRALVKRSDGSVALVAKREGQLYTIEENNQDEAATVADSNNDKLRRWHERYGHLNLNDLKRLKTQDMVIGIQINTSDKNFECEICHRGKMHQLPYKRSQTRESETLGLVHSDICGPISTPSIGGAKYFATFIDDKTRYTEVIMLKNRSDILDAFKNYMLRAEKETGCFIRKIRTDNAKEYISKDFSRFLESHGIRRQLSVEYTPQQNGVAERANRTLVEMARCMLLQANLPNNLWAEAINTANFIRNRCPTKALENTTPIEAWNGKKPYVGFMRTFGSKVIAHIKGPTKGKFAPTGRTLVMVGYASESKAYRLWEPGTRTIVKSRDVRFIENCNVQCDNNSETFEAPIFENREKKIGIGQNTPRNIEPNESSRTPYESTSENEHEENKDEHHEDQTDIEDEDGNEDTSNEKLPMKTRTSTVKTGPGRPKLVRTGKPGRPKRLFHERANISYEEPLSVSEALSHRDKDL